MAEPPKNGVRLVVFYGVKSNNPCKISAVVVAFERPPNMSSSVDKYHIMANGSVKQRSSFSKGSNFIMTCSVVASELLRRPRFF